nr:hypothetical protein [Candidatus Sigynarchaeota archaeon]
MKHEYNRSVSPPALVIPVVVEDKDRNNSMIVEAKVDKDRATCRPFTNSRLSDPFIIPRRSRIHLS